MALKIDTASTALGPVYLCYGAKDDQCHSHIFKVNAVATRPDRAGG